MTVTVNQSMSDVKQPNLLVLDTSNQYCSIALQWQGQVIEQHEWSEQKHSQMILPMVRALIAAQNADVNGLDAIVVGIGPGGFTGVRLAVAVAQGLAFAAQKPVIPVSSLTALAQSALNQTQAKHIVVAMDARMQQVYWASYVRDVHNHLHILTPPGLDDVADFSQRLAEGSNTDQSGVLVGNASVAFADIAAVCEQQHWIVPTDLDHTAPHAADLLPWANHEWQQGRTVAPSLVQPLYVRDKVALTIAERESS